MTQKEIGKNLCIDFDRVNGTICNDVDRIRELIHRLAEVIEVKILKEDFYEFHPYGITGFAIVSESHIAVHSWPEYGYIGIDIFSCKAFEKNEVIGMLKAFLESEECRYEMMERRTRFWVGEEFLPVSREKDEVGRG